MSQTKKREAPRPLSLMELYAKRDLMNACLQVCAKEMLKAKTFKQWSTVHDQVGEFLFHLDGYEKAIDQHLELQRVTAGVKKPKLKRRLNKADRALKTSARVLRLA